MYLIASGEVPFRRRSFDRNLVCDILSGLRPTMPDSAPMTSKSLAQWCCDADPDKRPDAEELMKLIRNLGKDDCDDWCEPEYNLNFVAPLSIIEKRKYSRMLLPTGDLPKPRNE